MPGLSLQLAASGWLPPQETWRKPNRRRLARFQPQPLRLPLRPPLAPWGQPAAPKSCRWEQRALPPISPRAGDGLGRQRGQPRGTGKGKFGRPTGEKEANHEFPQGGRSEQPVPEGAAHRHRAVLRGPGGVGKVLGHLPPGQGQPGRKQHSHNSFRRHLPRQMQVSSVDFSMGTEPVLQRGETTTSIGRIKPELYKQKSVDSEGNREEDVKTCGKLNFTLQYDYENELLIVKIIKALDLPAKDFTGTSDPYVKMYLLPDRKKKFQTRVHRKTLNPLFDETFQFPVAYDQLSNRKLHFSVYDFDRFSRHDMIGEVILDNLFEVSDLSREATVWKDIHCATTESIDLGEIMFSLCYLPTAGRMTLTVIKCRNLKAMDITGSSDPYVKVSLMCEGRRLKKRKTTTKKNTLNPVYNEAIIFDIPPENVDQVSLSIAVMDYDRVGHNEVIGVCRTGLDAEGLGRDHWNEMLAYHRKPITHWHPLLELPGRATSFDSQGSCPSPKPPSTP
uniref:C2 domain-containing protein n=1 Tax=Felis catus TaxID=9685 RepID=A0ABI7ZF26_FELCA